MSRSAECWEFSGERKRLLEKKPSFADVGEPGINLVWINFAGGGFGVTRQQPTMINLFPVEDSSAGQDVKPKNDEFPRQFLLPLPLEESRKKSVKPEPQSAPLTIFYGGQVMVFDDFPAEIAKQVIDLAHKGSAKSFTTELNNNQSAYTQNIAKNDHKEIAPEPIQTNKPSLACELPIARRASLHRFLEKRKDRITSKAPYQIDGSTEASSKPDTAWLGSQ
ncbi:hypothetical protein Bca52824_096224 [Brassica carinata]|uniref:Protein TIFY n=1 Tax=Brassica carinata TaxID=52824 RepID=A0A8X7NYQ2_BRACI|nr:hypothetical protein Bca52824_096224 [Brassica carinata]